MNTEFHPTEFPIEQHMAHFFASAEAIIYDGLQHARKDDPHRFRTMGREFDGGKALRRLQVDYLSDDRMRIALVFIGAQDGQEKAVEVFSTTVQGPRSGAVQ